MDPFAKKADMAKSAPGGELQASKRASLSETFPLVRLGKEAMSKTFVWPVTATLIFALLAGGDPSNYRDEMGGYLCFIMTYFVYRLCGKRQSIWVIAGIVIIELIVFEFLFVLEFLFGGIAGDFPDLHTHTQAWLTMNPLVSIWKLFFHTGLWEELIKAVPVLLLCLFGWAARKQPRTGFIGRWVAVREPLDGIVFAAVSAATFSYIETVGQYASYAVEDGGVEYALRTVLGRLLTEVCGHVAYSGYFGYFIGLAVLRPANRLKLFAVGWICSAFIHALWDALGSGKMPVLIIPVGIVAYMGLAAAILKARQISPARADNFASTTVFRSTRDVRVQDPPTTGPPVSQLKAKPADTPLHGAGSAGLADDAVLQLRLGPAASPLTLGASFIEGQLPNLTARSADRIVAKVTANPSKPSVLGLQNLSHQDWTATLTSGLTRIISADDVVRLDRTACIDFAGSEGVIEPRSRRAPAAMEDAATKQGFRQ